MIKSRRFHWFRSICWIVLFTFSSNLIEGDLARAWSVAEPQNIIMPTPGTLISSSPAFSLPTLKAISIDPKDPFKIDFVVDTVGQNLTEKIGQEQVNLLVKYFLSFLTLPEEELWVNLSPYEKDRIIAPEFETTNAGRDMLVQDYILKQLASSLTYPDHQLGKDFWKKVFNRVKNEYGSSDIPVSNFNKIWVVPDKAVVYEENGSAFIFESRLKVLTEEDYLSIEKNKNRPSPSFSKEQKIDHISSEITREIIIPELEREVNEGKYFAPLRQMYNSLILAIWFKKRYKESLISQMYVNQKKTSGIALDEKQIKEKIYAQYLKAFKKGVFNYIKEDPDPSTGQTIPRKYFSGGFSFADVAMRVKFFPATGLFRIRDQIGTLKKGLYRFTVALKPLGMSKKNLMSLMAGTLLMMGGIHQASASAVGNFAPKPAGISFLSDPQSSNDVYKASEIVRELNKIYRDDTEFSHIGSAIIHPIVPRLRAEREALQAFLSLDYAGVPENSDRMIIHKAASILDEAIRKKISSWGSKNTSQNFGDLRNLKNALDAFGSAIESIVNKEGVHAQEISQPNNAPIKNDTSDNPIIQALDQQIQDLEHKYEDQKSLKNVLGVLGEANETAINISSLRSIEDVAKQMLEAGKPLDTISLKIAEENGRIQELQRQENDQKTRVERETADARRMSHGIGKDAQGQARNIDAQARYHHHGLVEIQKQLQKEIAIKEQLVRSQASVVQPQTPKPAEVSAKPTDSPLQDLKKNEEVLQKGVETIIQRTQEIANQIKIKTQDKARTTELPASPTPAVVKPPVDTVNVVQDTKGSYVVSTTVAPIPIQDHVVAKNNGIVTGFDPDKKEYKKGELILSLSDPQLDTRIEQIIAEIEIAKKKLSDLKELFAKQAATSQEVTIAQGHVDELSQKLSQANQEKMASQVTAPHELTIQEVLVANGMQVNKEDHLLVYLDHQRIRVNFKLPASVNYFNRIDQLTVNGVAIKTILSVDWSPEPLLKDAQVSMVVVSSDPISLAQQVELKATILPPQAYFQDLNKLLGQEQTIASIREIKQYSLRCPADGEVKFLVQEGQMVQAGTVVAVVESGHYKEELKNIGSAIHSIDIQLKQAVDADGTLLITRDKIDSLKAQKSALVLEFKKIQTIIERLQVRSEVSGIVNSIAANESGVFHDRDELLRIGTGTALIGNINNTKDPILFPKELNIHNGDPVAVETPQGIRLPGKVISVNRTPYETTMTLGGFQALEIMTFDRQGILQSNLPVKVILSSTDQEKHMISDMLVEAEQANTTATSSVGGSPSPPPDDEIILPKYFIPNSAPVGSINLMNISNLATTTNLQPAVNLSQVQVLIDKNRLVTGALAIEVLQKKQEELLPKATRFSINGGVYMKDGKLVFGGGFKGLIDSSIGGGVQSGNAIGAAVPVVFQLAGNIIDVVSGKVTKETNLAKKMTEIAVHHMDTEIYHQVKGAQDLLIDIGAAEERIEHLKGIMNDLEIARSVILAREKGGFSLKVDRDGLEEQIQNIRASLLEWEHKKENWTVSFNSLIGLPNSDLHQAVLAELPWDKEFSTIDAQTERVMAQRLTGTNSPNSRMKEAIAADSAVDMTIKLQGINKLPILNFSSLYLSDSAGFNPLYNLSSSESLMRTSTLTQGANTVAQIEIPLFDSVVKTKEGIMSLEKEKSNLNIEKTRSELSQELSQAAGHIRNLSVQIQQAENSYQDTYRIWESKAKRSDIYLPYQLINDRIEMMKLQEEIIDLKSQYLKEESRLRKLGLLEQERSIQKHSTEIINSLQAVISDSIAADGVNSSEAFPQMNDLERAPNKTTLQRDSLLAAGIVHYQLGGDTPSAWALMHNDLSTNAGPLKIIKQILMEDSNVFVRNDTLHHFLNEYQNNNEFYTALEDIVLHSQHPDVVGELLKFMGQQEDHGIRFFVEMITESEANGNRTLADLSYRSLNDVFTMYPEVLQNLSRSDFINVGSSLYSQMSPESANKALLTFLLREPDDSIGKERLLQSNYWSVDDLANIHNSLSAYIDRHQGEGQRIEDITDLAGLIRDSILRKEALGNIVDTFRSGEFDHLGNIVLDRDIITSVEIKENAEANRSFLNTSPQWRKMKDYIHPQLYASAKQATSSFLSTAPYVLPSNFPIYDVSFPRSHQDELIYFKNLGIDGQGQYIAKSQSFPELVRMLDFKTPLRGTILDRLMTNAEGRTLVLKTYADTSDPELLSLIETRPWLNIIKTDIESVKNSSENSILRNALKRLYERTRENWTLDMLSGTYGILELHSVNTPLREAQINVAATKVALKILNDKTQHYRPVLWAGYSLQAPEEIQELQNIQHVIDKEIDPSKANDYVNSRIGMFKEDSKVKAMLNDLISIRNEVAERITNNDQSIPKFPEFLKNSVIALGLIPLAFLLKGLGKRIFIRRSNDNDLIQDLYRKLLDEGDSSITNDDLLIPPPDRVYNSTENLLKNWHGLVSGWEQEENLSIETILNDFNTILNCAEEVLNDMPYTPDLMWSEGKEGAKNDTYQKTFSYFNMMALNTLVILKKRLNVKSLTSTQRAKLKDDIQTLFDHIKYSSRFSRILSYRGNIEKVMSYKFPNDHWTEKFGIYPLIRKNLLYQLLWKKSENNLMKELPILLEEGNSLIDGFYENPPELVSKSVSLLKTVTDRGRTSYDPISRDDRLKFRMRSFYSRAFSLVGLGVTVATGVCLLLGVPGVSVGGLSLMSFISLGISYGAYWHPHLDILRMKWNKDMLFLVNKFKKEFEAMLNPSGNNEKQVVNKDHDAQIVSLARQEGKEQVRREMDLKHRPSVDMIVIISQEEANVRNLEAYVDARRDRLIRRDIPVVVTSSAYEGSGNVYLDALQRAKKKINSPEFRARYPHLKSWEESRVMFVFHGKDAVRDEKIETSLLDWGITNGYRAARGGSLEDDPQEGHKLGHILIYTRDSYFGPIPEFPSSGITMLTSRVNSRVLSASSLVNTRFTSTGQHEVIELLEGVDLNTLQAVGKKMPREGKLLNFLKDNFNLNNASLNQYPVSNGILLIGPDAVRSFTKTADYVETNNLWVRLRLSMSSDFLVPMIMGNVYDEYRETEVREYMFKRVRWKDMGKNVGGVNIQNEVQAFYNFLYETCGKTIKVNAFLPYSRSEFFVHITGSTAKEETDRFKKVINTDQSMLSTTGGVDLSETSNIINFDKKDEGFNNGPNVSLDQPLLKSFKGFEFQIIQSQPIVNPVELFLGSSGGKSGLWFSSKVQVVEHDEA